MYRIVCFGDSNTWGYNPETGERFDENTRWTALLQKKLGEEYQVVESGINGRTTSFDDSFRDYQNGRKGLGYSLMESKPIDLLIISLGTNDLKFAGAVGSAKGLDSLLRTARNSAILDSSNRPVFKGEEKILVVSPIYLGEALDGNINSSFYGKYQDSLRLAELYHPICEKHHVQFLDASLYAEPSLTDHIHMDAENHAKLAAAIYGKVKEMLA